MSEKYEVGQTVLVYGCLQTGRALVEPILGGLKATILEIMDRSSEHVSLKLSVPTQPDPEGGGWTYEHDKGSIGWVHSMQVRSING